MTDTARRTGSILGTRVLRTEDPDLLTGTARYLDDLQLTGATHAVFARSDIAHGTIRSIDIDEAVALPGVIAVLTASDLGVSPHHGFAPVHDDFKRPPLADSVVRYVGEPIAVVLAESAAIGEDAAQLVWADMDPLAPIIDMEAALASDALPIFPCLSAVPWQPPARDCIYAAGGI